MKLEIETQTFNENSKFSLSGFEFKYKNKKYIITTHHNLPIKEVSYNTLANNDKLKSEKLEVVINPIWNELLVLKSKDISKEIISKEMFFDKFLISIPEISSKVYIHNSNNNIEGYIKGIKFLSFDNINGYEIPYIVMKITDKKTQDLQFKGLSGSPVTMNNKLIGIFTKYSIEDSSALIIPTYILLRTLEKKDNNNIYTVNNINMIHKIGNYINKNNMIFHANMQIYILNHLFLNNHSYKYFNKGTFASSSEDL
jgi:hypothetical protein